MQPNRFNLLFLLCLWAAWVPAISPTAFSHPASSDPVVQNPPASPATSEVTSEYDAAMQAGYAAVENRDYQRALPYFQKALELRPGDTYAQKAIENVEGYLQRQKAQSADSDYDRAMRIGYHAAQNRDYQTALINFRRALKERPNDRYALQAIQNVESFISRDGLRLAGGHRPAAPWSNPALGQNQVPPVLLTEWRKAENRSTCAALAPEDLGKHADAQPRSAYFAGGWAIAYDKPGLPGRNPDGTFCPTCGRGVFGIAGTGVAAEPEDIHRWPDQKVWADGSRAGYGPAAGEGPHYLAYGQVKGQRCLYNVWSFLGKDHLEALLEQLRLVEGTT